MGRKLRTKKGRTEYAKRKGIIEPIFGQLKQVLGFRQFSLRGLAAMRSAWRVMCAEHNPLKFGRPNPTARGGRPNPPAPPEPPPARAQKAPPCPTTPHGTAP